MSAWPSRRAWERFDTADLLEAIAIIERRTVVATIERRPVDTFDTSTVAALRAELALRESTETEAG